MPVHLEHHPQQRRVLLRAKQLREEHQYLHAAFGPGPELLLGWCCLLQHDQRDTWHHGVWIVPSGYTANSQVLFYLDGTLQTTGTASGSTISTATGFVELGTGESTLSNMPYIGNLCDLRIYNRALTLTEVSNLYSGLNANGTTVVL